MTHPINRGKFFNRIDNRDVLIRTLHKRQKSLFPSAFLRGRSDAFPRKFHEPGRPET